MHEQQRLRQQARIRNLVEELAEDPHLTAQMIHELSKRLPQPRDFALRVAVTSKDEGLDLLGHFSESYKMAARPADLGALFRKHKEDQE